MSRDRLSQKALEYHSHLPGLIRAFLRDAGVSDSVINRRLIGFDGRNLVSPVQDGSGRVLFFERWKSPEEAKGPFGVPAKTVEVVELYPRPALRQTPMHIIICQGVLETLILESHGFTAVTATGSGTVFKKREWAPVLEKVPYVFVAYRKGVEGDALAWRLERAIPHARRVVWPEAVANGQGVSDFFVRLRRSAEDFRELLAGDDTAAA